VQSNTTVKVWMEEDEAEALMTFFAFVVTWKARSFQVV
jgi:hypothetical protein